MADINALMNGINWGGVSSIYSQLPGQFQQYLTGMGYPGTPTTTPPLGMGTGTGTGPGTGTGTGGHRRDGFVPVPPVPVGTTPAGHNRQGPPAGPGVPATPPAPSHRPGGKNPFTEGVPYAAPQPAAAAPAVANPFTGGGGGGGGAANTFASYAPPNWDDYASLANLQGSGIAYDGSTYYDWNLDPTNSMGYGVGSRVGSPFD